MSSYLGSDCDEPISRSEPVINNDVLKVMYMYFRSYD